MNWRKIYKSNGIFFSKHSLTFIILVCSNGPPQVCRLFYDYLCSSFTVSSFSPFSEHSYNPLLYSSIKSPQLFNLTPSLLKPAVQIWSAATSNLPILFHWLFQFHIFLSIASVANTGKKHAYCRNSWAVLADICLPICEVGKADLSPSELLKSLSWFSTKSFGSNDDSRCLF